MGEIRSEDWAAAGYRRDVDSELARKRTAEQRIKHLRREWPTLVDLIEQHAVSDWEARARRCEDREDRLNMMIFYHGECDCLGDGCRCPCHLNEGSATPEQED